MYKLKNKNINNARKITNLVSKVFGLNKNQIASIIGISRIDLYNDINKENDIEDISAYNNILKIATILDNQIDSSLKYGLKTILVDGRTLLSYLKDNNTSPEKVCEISLKVFNILSERKIQKISKEDQKASVKSNSISGF